MFTHSLVNCEICRTPTSTADLTESYLPHKVLDLHVPGLRATDSTAIVTHRLVWTCPQCPTFPSR